MSDDFYTQQRYDLQGEAELSFLRAQGHQDQFILNTLLPLRQKGRRRWFNRISARQSYSRNRETRKARARVQSAAQRAKIGLLDADEKEYHRQKKRAQQQQWRDRNRHKLAEKERLRRARIRETMVV